MKSSSDLVFVYSQFLVLTVSGLPAYGRGSDVTSESFASHQSKLIQTVTLSIIALTVIIVPLVLCAKGRKKEANDGVQDVYAVPNKKAKKKSKCDEKAEVKVKKAGDDVMQVNALYTEYKESKQVSRKGQKPKKKKQKKTEAVYENVEQNTGNTTGGIQDVYAKPNKKAKKNPKRKQEHRTEQTYENVDIGK
ncbi:cylicin-1-like [Haliotis asinina]|uniref:cylicin-1-like n=1 Tax=Haliotis asinina TaxID=109174 RepID=UPI0035319C29